MRLERTVLQLLARRAFALAFGSRNGYLLLALTVTFGILAVFAPTYFNLDNLRVVTLNMSAIGIGSLGMAFLIIAGKVDLSVGSIFAAAAISSSWLSTLIPPPVAILGGIAVGGLLGLINGILVWRIRVSPIIVTLGTLTLFLGLLLIITGGRAVSGVPDSFTSFGRALPLGIPSQVLILGVAAVASQFVLSQTTIGRHIYAVGGNQQASALAGLNVRRLVLALFLIDGAFAGLAGVLDASRFGTASTDYGVSFNLDVITAVILGGIAFSGGEGAITGVMLAVLFLAVIDSGLISLGVDPYYTFVIRGAALVISVGIDQVTQERRERYRKLIAMAEWRAAALHPPSDGPSPDPSLRKLGETSETSSR